ESSASSSASAIASLMWLTPFVSTGAVHVRTVVRPSICVLSAGFVALSTYRLTLGGVAPTLLTVLIDTGTVFVASFGSGTTAQLTPLTNNPKTSLNCPTYSGYSSDAKT